MMNEQIKQLEELILKMDIEISKKKVALNDLMIAKKEEELKNIIDNGY